ncbi:PAS domain S-box-containing protein [Dethiosulfatibacter aminovorans DSM 17477]|uniref:PAS domain S-box-containing protein n=1 Tax=Dethiosulfatibacter aminovorans DSM 17477 TaxID=1121476 RepID=A0A1M6AMQ8_9FIRM|nr:sigma 54-interacting transcriptional regulator [Dethiosulfatibacter aminovorans]SHI37804.1 PAS domain S-box-containing protein [Dethiosulfatibacter aminovorans DSM 17477]
MLISDKEFRRVIDNLHDEIMIYDDNYRLVYVNNATKKHYGIDPEDLIGKKFSDLDETYWGNSTLPEVYNKKKIVAKRQITNQGIDIVTISTPIFDKNNDIKYVGQNVNEINTLNEFSKNDCIDCEWFDSDEDTEYIYKSKEMEKTMSNINKIKNLKSTCLLIGETGTGKSHLAKYMHISSKYKNKPFVSINCACMNPNLIESELFGYEKGAFTGANARGKEGLVEAADNGILFLDEISEIPLEFQAKLLHFLQYQEFIPVGGSVKKEVNVKIIAATNRSLSSMVEQKAFREDLYYRLNTFEIKLLPLRERREDLKLYIDYFLDKFNNSYFRKCKISPEALNVLFNYSWPGNVREVEHIIEKAVVLSKDKEIKINDLPKRIFEYNTHTFNSMIEKEKSFDELMDSVESKIINEYYKQYKTSIKVAEVLGISQSKAYRLIKKHVLDEK